MIDLILRLAAQFKQARPATEATFKKLRDGTWGLLVNSDRVSPGDETLTVTKAGKRETKVIGQVVWRGQGVSICTIAAGGRTTAPSTSNRNRPPSGMYECEECGDYVKPGTICWETGARH